MQHHVTHHGFEVLGDECRLPDGTGPGQVITHAQPASLTAIMTCLTLKKIVVISQLSRRLRNLTASKITGGLGLRTVLFKL